MGWWESTKAGKRQSTINIAGLLLVLTLCITLARTEENGKERKEKDIQKQTPQTSTEFEHFNMSQRNQHNKTASLKRKALWKQKRKNKHRKRMHKINLVKGISTKGGTFYLEEQTRSRNQTQERDNLYRTGSNILKGTRDKTKRKQAYQLLMKAADLGSTRAMEKIAYALLFGDQLPQNITAAKILYEALAEEGSPRAHTALGFIHATGTGVYPNQAKALVYYTFAAIGGNHVAQMILSYRYSAGISIPHNCEAALIQYRNVAKHVANKLTFAGGILGGKVRLTERHENPYSSDGVLDLDLYQYSKFLAEKGEVQAQVTLGQLHLVGGRGLEQDPYKAFYYFSKAVKAGSTYALAFLGKMYSEGSEAVPQDNETAFKYFKMAADRGNPLGLNDLGLAYLHGKGVPVSYTVAFQYFQKAAEKKWIDAQYQLGLMHYYGLGVRQDYALAYKYFHLASQSGHVLAFYQLAHMYATGTRVARSCHTAVELYKNVCEQGSWSEKFLSAYFAFREGDIDSSLLQYMLLSEMGYEVAQSNAAFILESKQSTIVRENQTYPLAQLLWIRAANQVLNIFLHLNTLRSLENSRLAKYHVNEDVHLAKRFYDMALQSSQEAYAPVLLALAKLEVVHFFSEIQRASFTLVWQHRILNMFRFYWDLLVIALLTVFLLVLIAYRPT
nr:PREDICTED: protein sel-1 homolog 2 [Latimeria chalumnae]|eukprot:XP_014343320.1 PREDICTED: protein sel-1 homolog 2 [Latimeria chalumnae]